MLEDMYKTGEYLEKNPTWHAEDSPWKAKQILRIMAQNNIVPTSICEVGCGAGEILKQLQKNMNDECVFWGYEISPQAFELSKSRENEKLHFKLANIKQEKDAFFDLILLIDLIEHVEDYYSFLREIKPKSNYKILHIPLELTMNTVVSGKLINSRQSYGHIHHFTKDIAVQVLKDVGYEVIDYIYTASSIELSAMKFKSELKRKLLKVPRKLLFAIHGDLAVRVLGGWSLLVLAR